MTTIQTLAEAGIPLDGAKLPTYTHTYRDRLFSTLPCQGIGRGSLFVTDTIDPALWVDAYGDYLYRFAFSRLKNATVAEDLVQETFLAGLKGRERFAGTSSQRTWLVGILKNKIIDHIRKSSREVPLEIDDQLAYEREGLFNESGEWRGHWESGPSLAPSEWGNPAELLEKKEFLEIVRKCLEALPTRMSRVFALRELDDTPTREVCELFNVSESNLFVILHRARAQMRRCVEKKWMGNVKGRGETK